MWTAKNTHLPKLKATKLLKMTSLQKYNDVDERIPFNFLADKTCLLLNRQYSLLKLKLMLISEICSRP